MPIGPTVRRMFGRHEHLVAALYRSVFIDIDAYCRQISAWVPQARRILEVGCGEGAVTERLVKLYPDADIMAIDVTPNAGRLFRGCRERVSFEEKAVQSVALKQPGQFDLVVLSDVIHHVPTAMRRELLSAVRQTVAPEGSLIFKDWERTPTPIHWLCHAGDRWLTGDHVDYLSKTDADAMLAEAFGHSPIVAEARVRPWRNNFAMLARA